MIAFPRIAVVTTLRGSSAIHAGVEFHIQINAAGRRPQLNRGIQVRLDQRTVLKPGRLGSTQKYVPSHEHREWSIVIAAQVGKSHKDDGASGSVSV